MRFLYLIFPFDVTLVTYVFTVHYIYNKLLLKLSYLHKFLIDYLKEILDLTILQKFKLTS